MTRNFLLLMIIVGSVYLILDSLSEYGTRRIDKLVKKYIPAKIGFLGA